VDIIWKQDLTQAFKKADDPFPIHKEPTIEIIDDLSILNSIQSLEVAFDIETTGLKPHADGHRIICASIADSPLHAFTFIIPDNRAGRQPLIDLLLSTKIGKIAHNMKFEHTWGKVRLKVEIQNWTWDTMIASHILENRPGITGLKFQTYVNFGIVDYASDVAYYLQTDEPNNSNAINRINSLLQKQGGKKQLLQYCGLDSIFEYRLAMKQREDILPF
jgi:hypothetical protein